MKSQIRTIFFGFTAFILLVDGLVFGGLTLDYSALLYPLSLLVFWLVPLIFITGLYIYSRSFLAENKPGFFAGFYMFTGFFLAFYVPKLLYLTILVLEYALKLLLYPVLLIINDPSPFGEFLGAGPLNLISILVLPLSAITFVVFIWGMLFGRFNFRLRPLEVFFSDLPPEFDGYRIIHISDLHLGSLHGQQDKIRKAINLINKQSPDLILFTGDLVNNLAEETEGWEELLAEMNAPDGKYAILGNHDYGEYYNWPNEHAHKKNMEKLIKAHEDSGFALLLNRSVKIVRGSEEVFLAGVENWGLPPFKQYGDLAKALQDIPDTGFKILMSHDPSHWDAEVIKDTNVNLTLSGHTHGMQFGIRIGKFRWSPIQIKYPRWIGLYQQGYQYLYVNPGLGYIGYAGRIWIPPEISIITLRRSTS